jgi:hypothetical protein
MKQIKVETTINSTKAVVWSLLTGQPGFIPQELQQAVKEGKIGEELNVKMAAENGKAATFKIRLEKVILQEELLWRGKLWAKGIFDGEHEFKIVENGANNRVVFIEQETFTGLLVPFLGKTIEATEEEFKRTVGILKTKAEEQNSD